MCAFKPGLWQGGTRERIVAQRGPQSAGTIALSLRLFSGISRMRLLPGLAVVVCFSLAACAGKPARSQPLSADDSNLAQADTATDSSDEWEDDDFAALYGDSAHNPNPDPWEAYNRRVHRFNNAVDRAIARPVARGYARAVPRVAQTGVSNFFKNLGSPLTMVNQVLQGHPGEAWDTLGRFVMNTTLGIGGLFDPASKAQIPQHNADFGQTFAMWGWRQSRYVELPFFGPRTVRDTFGMAADAPVSPLWYVDNHWVRYSLHTVHFMDIRAQLLPLDELRGNAADDYSLIRDAWLQRRNYQIDSDRRQP